jgi:pilus assembly protein CpaC
MKPVLFLLSFLMAFQVFAQEKVEEQQIDIVLGIDKIVKLDFVAHSKLQVGNQTLVGYTLIPQKKEITFKGLRPGRTSVTVRNTVGDIKARFLLNITASDLSNLVLELKEFLGDIEGLEIGIKGDSVYLGGQIVVPSDYGMINLVLKKYGDKGILDMVELSPQTQRMVAQKMQEEIQKNGMKNVTVRIVNKAYWLEGFVTSKSERSLAGKIAVAFMPESVSSLAEREGAVQKAGGKKILHDFIVVNKKKAKVTIPKMVKITAQFVLLNKDYTRVFGFKWIPVLGGDGAQINFGKTSEGGVGTKSQNSFSGTISNLLPKLASAKSAGYARVIQSGVVVVKDKVQAHLRKNVKQPFSLGSGEFTRAEEANAGFDLKVTPTILSKERVDLNIGVGVSAIEGNPPNTQEQNVTTQLVLKSKESAAVGGVSVQQSTTAYDKDPPFGEDSFSDVQPLFTFIRSKNLKSNRNQFVVFVTPELIDSAHAGTEDILRKFRKRSR